MKTLLTHNSTFHADDVFAVATFLLAHSEEKWKIVRSRDKVEIESADAVIDVGDVYNPVELRFDHHQSGGAGVRPNGIPYASFGLVWKEYGAVVCGGDFFVAKQIEDALVCSLDANDNGVKIADPLFDVFQFDLSTYVKVRNLTWKEEVEYGDKAEAKRLEAFLSLVDFASSLINREIKRYKDKNEAFEIVNKAYEEAEDKRLVVLNNFYPWQDAVMAHNEPLFVVYPTDLSLDKWAIKSVPVSKNSFESRKSFPKDWAGKRDSDLEVATGVKGALFCHNAGFLVVVQGFESAITIAKKVLNA